MLNPKKYQYHYFIIWDSTLLFRNWYVFWIQHNDLAFRDTMARTYPALGTEMFPFPKTFGLRPSRPARGHASKWLQDRPRKNRPPPPVSREGFFWSKRRNHPPKKKCTKTKKMTTPLKNHSKLKNFQQQQKKRIRKCSISPWDVLFFQANVGSTS